MTPLVAYCPGGKLICPKCNSKKITLFFKPGFPGNLQHIWCKVIDDRDFSLCDDYEIILKCNFNPNWVCKKCYNGGVVLKNE